MPSALLAALLFAASDAAPAHPAVTPPAVREARAPEPPAVPTAPAHPASASGTAALEAASAPSSPEREDPAKVEARAEPLPSRGPGAKSEAVASSRPVPAATPPSLTARALVDELRRSARDRREEQSSLAEQREKLGALQKEIDASRAALRDETRRLQEIVAGAGPRKGPAGATAKDGLDGLARTVRNMRPDAAAAMVARLDRGLAAAVLGRMKPADAALVLEKLDPATSAALLALLAGRDRS